MKSELKLTRTGGSVCLIIPKLYLHHIDCDEGDEIILKDDNGKHGNFLSLWKKNEVILSQAKVSDK